MGLQIIIETGVRSQEASANAARFAGRADAADLAVVRDIDRSIEPVMQHLLEIVGIITRVFGSVQVLKTCSMTVAAKETVVVIGPSGSGKSTLLRSINLLEPVDSGGYLLCGREHHARAQRAHLLRRQIGMVSRTSSFSLTLLRRSESDASDR